MTVPFRRQSGADVPLDHADERMRRWRGVATLPLLRLTFAAERLGLDRSWCRWDSRGKASSHPRLGRDAKPPVDPGFLRLRQTRDGASLCCGPFSSYWSSSRWRYSSFAASAERVGAAVAAVASRCPESLANHPDLPPDARGDLRHFAATRRPDRRGCQAHDPSGHAPRSVRAESPIVLSDHAYLGSRRAP